MTDRDRIVVPVVTSDSRREQIERRVFEQLAALRIADRADAAVPAPRRLPWAWLAAGGGAALAAIALVIALRGTADPAPVAASPALIQTPAGGASRFTVDEAVIDAGSDTSVLVQQDAVAGVSLVLARGSVDCDVEPRPNRRFRVVAGDVTVAVVGTRFSVARTATGVRVDVARGKVRVTSPSGERFVAAGDSWTSPATATASAPSLPSPTAPPPLPPPPSAPPSQLSPPSAPTSHAAFIAAQRLEAHDPTAAARGYRAVAGGRDRWAALALYSLAELDVARRDTTDALGVLDEYNRRFPGGANAEDVAWLRVETLRTAGRGGEARAAAASYRRAFPDGTYIKAAERIADPTR